ncbi:MAG: hypothetical protein C0478_16545 [Planctomyces sp.]|nr:hypothetical protein [Planctomyces sp.]
MKTDFHRLFQYTAWADQRTLSALQEAPAAQAEALPLLAHLFAAEHVWLSRLRHEEPRHAVWPALDLDQCAALAAENEAGYIAFVGQLQEEQLATSVQYRNSQRQEFVTSVHDILMQVLLHGPYHRGQIAKIIGQTGGQSINTDFITFARETDYRS